MKFLSSAIISSAFALTMAQAADVTYSVIAFPQSGETVVVNVDNMSHPLQQSSLSENLFSGIAPYGSQYNYAYSTPSGQRSESTVRHLASESVTTTGNEFFNRSKTVYDVPEFPKAYNAIYPSYESPMSRSNEIATILLKADMKSLDEILQDPEGDHKYSHVYNMTYINSDSIFNFEGAGISNSGQSSKNYAKQSYKIKFNKYNKGAKASLFNRKSVKLRAEAVDPTLVREKLYMDSLAAAGAATLNGHWVRLFVNNESFGLYLMIDDANDKLFENLVHGGAKTNATGPIYKGNAMDHTREANLVYKGPSNSSYDFEDIYVLKKAGRDKSITKKSYTEPLITFMEQLNHTVIGSDAQTPGNISDLMDNTDHTMLHIALNFLAGSWDGVWYQASNFYLHQNRENFKWYLVSYDFDETFGNRLNNKELMTVPYQNYTRPGSSRPLMDVFVKSPYYQPKFEEMLQTITKAFFNPQTIKARLDAWNEMLKDDIAWDYSLTARGAGREPVFTVDGFSNNMYSTVNGNMGILEWVSNRTSSLQNQLNFSLSS
ncbi:coth protein-domain-containing protein [Blakeslea trispora]|nr:coth protein-domain-containing protein [Blakeslea trispora]